MTRTKAAPLPDEAVREILCSYHVSHKEMARRLGRSHQTIAQIRLGQVYCHRLPELPRWVSGRTCEQCLHWDGRCDAEADAQQAAEAAQEPPAEGEGRDLAVLLSVGADCAGGARLTSAQCRRAADILTRLALQPVPVSTRYEFLVFDNGDEVQAGGDAQTLEDAQREGSHYLAQYLQDGPHYLELRRVDVLSTREVQP